ncbi:MBL fold metallo-hydrolase [Schaalia vaccimaxillae]|uniref:MBL fold metallo-hydrolase n=1 Tax=Schaalia vaccimaxillae TaxID=183916 RepID=UPI0003B6E2FC|nr:MBL fold metallo-hydrolase [Schaalia vaccimaxillae]
MKLTVVGCTGSMSGPASPASCYLVQAIGEDPATGLERLYTVVLDLGPGAFGALWRHVDPRELDAVYLSHCHADHMGDIISLQVHRRWGPGVGLPALKVLGPEGTLDRIRQIDGGEDPGDFSLEFDVETLSAGAVFEVGPMTLTAFPGVHTVDSFGVRIDGPSQEDPKGQVSLFYTGDTDESESIARGARSVDLLLSEVGFTQADTAEGIHLNGVKAGALAADAQVGRLVATHIQPWTDLGVVEAELRQTWSGQLDFAAAGAIYSI